MQAVPRPADVMAWRGRIGSGTIGREQAPIALPSRTRAALPQRRRTIDRREVAWLRITFHGAARQITGSAHLLEIGSRRILLDCGLFDSDRIDPNSPNRQFSFDPRALDAVIVSHAHNDHIGRLPCLIRAGYTGPIYHHARHRRHRQRHAARQCADPA